MKRINSVIANKSVGSKIIEKRAEEVLKHPYIVKFIMENQGDIYPSQLKPHLSKLIQYIQEKDNCKNCPGLKQCPNLMQGHYSYLKAYMGHLDVIMKECSKLEMHQMEQRRKTLIQCHDVPEEIQNATFEDTDMEGERIKAIDSAIEFCNQCAANKKGESNKIPRGIYLYGSFGVGKSHIAGAIANTLANYDIPVVMVHMPTLANEMRDTVSESMRGNTTSPTVSKKLNVLSEVPVLILDDIGTETYTFWLRDNVLGTILQARATKKLPTIYTSNLTLDELQERFSIINNKGQFIEERVGAARLMERIRPYVIPIEVIGRNRRYDPEE